MTVDQINVLVEHLIWPVLIIIFILAFKEKLSSLFENISRLKISELEAEFENREKDFADEEVSPLADEIDTLRERIESLESQLLPKQHNISAVDLDKQDDAIRNRILTALEKGAFRWRTIDKLVSIS